MALGFSLGALIPNEVCSYQWLPLLLVLLIARAISAQLPPWGSLECASQVLPQPCGLFFPNLWTLAAIEVFVLALWENRLFRFEVDRRRA
jgi:hypothetical protein